MLLTTTDRWRHLDTRRAAVVARTRGDRRRADPVAPIEDRSVPWVVIARRIGRHPPTVMREVTTNGGRGRYRPAVAERRADRERCRPRRLRLASPGPLWDRVTAELKLGRSPYAIWADLVAEAVRDRVCIETIYQAVYAGVFEVTPSECLRSRRPRRQTSSSGPSRACEASSAQHLQPSGHRQ